MNCNTSYVIYRLKFPCGCLYVGRTNLKLIARSAEHEHVRGAGNPQCPMALNYESDRLCYNLKVSDILNTGWGGGRLKRPLLYKASFFLMYTLKATQHPILNEELDFSIW